MGKWNLAFILLGVLVAYTLSGSIAGAYSFHPRHETGTTSIPYLYQLTIPTTQLLPVNSTMVIVPVNVSNTGCVSIGGVAWIDLVTGSNGMSIITRSTSCTTNETLTGYYVDPASNTIVFYGGMNKTPFLAVVKEPTMTSINSGSISVKEYEIQLPAVKVLSASYSNGIVVFATSNVTSGEYQGYMLVGYINTNNNDYTVYAFKLVNQASGSSLKPVSVAYTNGKIVIVAYRSISLLDLTTGTLTSYVISGIPSGNPYDYETYTNGTLVYYAERGTYSGNYESYVFIGRIGATITGNLYKVPSDEFNLNPYGLVESSNGYLVYLTDAIFNLTASGGEAYNYKYTVSTSGCSTGSVEPNYYSAPTSDHYYRIIHYGNFTLATLKSGTPTPVTEISYKGVEVSIEKTVSFQTTLLTASLEESSNIISIKGEVAGIVSDMSSKITVTPSLGLNPIRETPICTWSYSLSLEAYSPSLIKRVIAGYYLGEVNRIVLGRTTINPILIGYNGDTIVASTDHVLNIASLASMTLVNTTTSSLPASLIPISPTEYSIASDSEALIITGQGQITGIYTEYTSNNTRYYPLLIAPYKKYVIVGDINDSAHPPVILLSVFNKSTGNLIAGYKVATPQGANDYTISFTATHYEGEPLIIVSGNGYYNNQLYTYVLLIKLSNGFATVLLVKIQGTLRTPVVATDGSTVYIALSGGTTVLLGFNPSSGSITGYSYNLGNYDISQTRSIYINDTVIVLSSTNSLVFINKSTMKVNRVIILSTSSTSTLSITPMQDTSIEALIGGGTTLQSAIGGYYHSQTKKYDLVLYWNNRDNAELLVRLKAFTKVFPVRVYNDTVTPSTINMEISSATPVQGYNPPYTVKTETVSSTTSTISEIDSSDYSISTAKATIIINAPSSITRIITSGFTTSTGSTSSSSMLIPLSKEDNITAYVSVSGRRLIVSRIAVRPPVLVASGPLERAVMKDNPERLEITLSEPSTVVFITTTTNVEGVIKDSEWFVKSGARGLGKITIWNGDYKVFVFDPSNATILLSSNSTSNNSTGSTIGESSRSSSYLGGIAVTIGSASQVLVVLLVLLAGLILVIRPALRPARY